MKEKTPDEVWWQNLATLATQLYPYGPGQDEIWSRAGGDIAALNVQSSGKGGWHAALRMLRLGGGGDALTPLALIRVMLEDYPANEDLKRLTSLLGSIPSQTHKDQRGERDARPIHVSSGGEQAIKILVLAANPKNTTQLRLDEEVREIEEGLRRSNQRDLFKIAQKWAVRVRDVRRALLDENPQIVHFSGHGATDGLILESPTGESQLVSPDALSGLFELFTAQVKCVLAVVRRSASYQRPAHR